MDTLSETDGQVRSVLVAFGLTVAGFLTAELMTTPVILMDTDLITDPAAVSRHLVLTFFVLNFVGFAVAGAAYLAYTGRGWAFVDLEVPSLRDWKYAVLGVVGSFALVIVVGLLASLVDLPATENQIVEFVGDDSTLVLYLIAMAFLFNAPAEEFLFRNVIQKRLYAAFTRMGAVVITSVIFALVHFPVYAATADSLDPIGLLGVAVSLTIVFGGSIIFGYIYVRTENLVVPTLAHAGFNAIQFANLYVLIEYAPEELEAAALIGALTSVPIV